MGAKSRLLFEWRRGRQIADSDPGARSLWKETGHLRQLEWHRGHKQVCLAGAVGLVEGEAGAKA